MFKKISMILIAILCTITLFPQTSNAMTRPFEKEVIIEKLDNGDYYETVIETDCNAITFAATNSITKTKTTYYKNSAGVVQWSVSIKATFSYNGSTATCTSCSHSTTSPGTNWSISSASSKRSGNSATATATAVEKANGISNSVTRFVTIKCSPTGVVS